MNPGSKLSSSFLRFVYFVGRPNIFCAQCIAFMVILYSTFYVERGSHILSSLTAFQIIAFLPETDGQRRAPFHFSMLPQLMQSYWHANSHTLLHNGRPWWHFTYCDPYTAGVTRHFLQSAMKKESRGISTVKHLQIAVSRCSHLSKDDFLKKQQ